MEVISRADARELGLKRYFTGKACKHGHASERPTSTGNCVTCTKISHYKWRDKNRECYNKHIKKWQENNPGYQKKYYATYPEKYKDRVKQWKDNNPEFVSGQRKRNNQQRRGRKHSAEGRFTKQDVDAMFNNQKGECLTCFVQFSDETPYTIDHDIPLSRGGSNWPSNLNLLCKSCNSSKCDKTLAEFTCEVV